MTDPYKPIYLAACEALFDGKPTEYFEFGEWTVWDNSGPFARSTAKFFQWRPVDSTREYREAFAAGKRVESQYDDGQVGTEWELVQVNHQWGAPFVKYRIVEPKTVRLYPFFFQNEQIIEGRKHNFTEHFQSIEDAKKWAGDEYKVYPIDTDGSTEVQP